MNKRNDWRGLLKLANEELLKDGYKICVFADDDVSWQVSIGFHDETVEDFADNYDEEYLSEIINEAWAHVRAKIRAAKEKLYIVTYVGLSDDDFDANGYLECKPFRTLEKAREILKTWRQNEIDNLEDEGNEYEIFADEDDEFRMEWCGGSEGIRIEIHEVTL